MEKKVPERNGNGLLIILVSLAIMGCVVSGVTRFLFPYHVSSKWTEGIVGLGMASGIFWMGVLIMTISIKGLRYSKTTKTIQKILSLLGGIILIVLGLLIAFSVVLDLFGFFDTAFMKREYFLLFTPV